MQNGKPTKPATDTEVVWHRGHVSADARRRLLRQDPATVWLTGLSGAGKSTIAFELERRLLGDGRLAYVLDGDNMRHGLSRDLDFSHRGRTENIRRVAEVARLFNDAGMFAIAAFISPYREDRDTARRIVGEQRFFEIHLCADIAVCERRDPKGLYEKARRGAIPEFTGISAPYEIPDAPALKLDTGKLSIAESIDSVMRLISPRFLGDKDVRSAQQALQGELS